MKAFLGAGILVLMAAAACSGGDSAVSADAGMSDDAGVPLKEEYIGTDGGTVTLLRFVQFGDIQPKDLDDDGRYPSITVQSIFTQAAGKKPNFMTGVGDYIFADSYDHAVAQMDMLLEAEKPYPHTIIHPMGNHECTGYTNSNCPNGNETGQVKAYFEKLLTFSSTCYFKVDIKTSLGDAKVVYVCANGWNSTQETWLRGVMAQQTKYTFVVRHEPPSVTEAPGVSPSEPILKAYKNTLYMYGHIHEYQHLSTNEVISGNGGATLAGDFFGYLFVEQLPDGNVKVTEYKQGSDEAMDSFTLTPDGQRAD